jgi:hypothetical protein
MTVVRPRYELVHITPGYVIIEQARHSGAARSYFCAEAVEPKEEYREGDDFWRFVTSAQSFRFDIRDSVEGTVTEFPELLGLLYWGACDPTSELYRIGELALDNRISVYVAITYEAPDGSPRVISDDKIRLLNGVFNERLQTKGKKILILPDLFGLYRKLSHGQLMIDFGLTSMTE